MKSTNFFNKIYKKKINKLRSILLIKTSNELSIKSKRNLMKINGISISDLNNNYNNLEINIKNPLEKGDSNRYGNYSTNILHINFNDSILYENYNLNLFNNKKLNSNEIEFLRTRTKSIISKNNLKENNNNNNNENIIKISKNKEKESLFYLRKLANLFKNYKLDYKKEMLKIKRENFKKNKSSNCFRKIDNNNNENNKNNSNLKVLIKNLFNDNNNENNNENNNNENNNENNENNENNNENEIDSESNDFIEEKINSNSFTNNFYNDFNENNIKHSSTIKNEILKRIFIKEKILNFNNNNNKNKKNKKYKIKINYCKTNSIFKNKNKNNNNNNFINSPILNIKKNKFNKFFSNEENEEKFSTNKKITRQDLINKCLNFE